MDDDGALNGCSFNRAQGHKWNFSEVCSTGNLCGKHGCVGPVRLDICSFDLLETESEEQ